MNFSYELFCFYKFIHLSICYYFLIMAMLNYQLTKFLKIYHLLPAGTSQLQHAIAVSLHFA